MRSRLILPLLAGLAMVHPPALALPPLVDQSQPDGRSQLVDFSFINQAQSFTPTVDSIVGASVFLSAQNDPSNAKIKLTVELWSALPAANLAASARTPLRSAAVEGRPGDWVDALWDPYTIAPKATYFLVFWDGQPKNAFLGAGTDDPYPAGMAFFGNSTGWNTAPDSDFAFKTYFPNPIPEPQTVVLMSVGLLLLAGIARRRIARRQRIIPSAA